MGLFDTDIGAGYTLGGLLILMVVSFVVSFTLCTALWFGLGETPMQSVRLGLAGAVIGQLVMLANIATRTDDEDETDADTDTETATDNTTDTDTDPVDRLQQRYVDGEITDDEFEKRLERLAEADADHDTVDGPFVTED